MDILPLDVSPLNWMFRPLDISPPGHFTPWTFRPQDILQPGRFAYLLDVSPPTVVVSPRQWTFRPRL